MSRPTFDPEPGTLLPLGPNAVLMTTHDARGARALAAELSRDLPGVEVTPGLCSVLVSGVAPLDRSRLFALIEGDHDVPEDPMTLHEIPVTPNGPDLQEAAQLLGLSPAEIVRELLDQELEVAVLGFSPGFGYLTGLRGPLASLARRSTPRARVPAGSLAVASGMAAIYPQSSPGGWWLLGTSDVALFDQDASPPALFAPGDHVRFVDAARCAAATPRPRPPHARSTHGALEVAATSPWITVVDAPRRSVAAFGVPPSGPFDSERAWLARQLVGGAEACVEVTGTGLALRAHRPVTIAAVDLAIRIDGRAAPEGTPVAMGVDQELRVERLGLGNLGYLAIAGGPGGRSVFHSRGTDLLSQVGPGPLQVGDHLEGDVASSSLPRHARPIPRGPVVLRISAGPHESCLVGGMSALDGWEGIVDGASSKVGVRFRGSDEPLPRRRGEITSIPVVTGAVQVPPDATAIVLGPDHATLGGYPIPAVVIEADLALLGRLSPGERVTFRVVDPVIADEEQRQRHAVLASLLEGASPGSEDQGRLANWG